MKPTCLILEDDPDLADLMEFALSDFLATSCRESLSAWGEKEIYDLGIVDLSVVLNPKLFSEFKSKVGNIKHLYVCSGRDEKELPKEILLLDNYRHFFSKPLKVDLLREEVHAFLVEGKLG